MAEITEFVPIDTVDPVYYDKPYYLAPDKGGAKPYALLAKALRESKRCALGRWAARGKQYIIMIRPVERGLVMQQLMYAAEVRPFNEIEIAPTDVKEAELKLAKQLIDAQTSKAFDPAQYKDDVAERIHAAIERKVAGQEIVATLTPETTGGGQVIDLMEALRASLEKRGSARPAGPGAKPGPKASAPEVRKPAKKAPAAAVPTGKKVKAKA
jgi:DNA end-binding protein Ku